MKTMMLIWKLPLMVITRLFINLYILDHVVAQTNLKHMYWSFRQMLAHHTVNGCNMRTGDICGTGTISGPVLKIYRSSKLFCLSLDSRLLRISFGTFLEWKNSDYLRTFLKGASHLFGGWRFSHYSRNLSSRRCDGGLWRLPRNYFTCQIKILVYSVKKC